MNTVRCIYILERKHLLILVNIWLLFIWYICTYAAVMQLCSEPRWHCFWSHVFALIKQTAFFLSYTDDHKHFMSFDDALSSFHLWCLTDPVSGNGGVKHIMLSCGFWNIPVIFHVSRCVKHVAHKFKGLWSVNSTFSCISSVNQYHLL